MRENPSLADQAVFVLGEIDRIADGMLNDDPMRHVVRGMKRAAERAIENGLRLAQEIVDNSKNLRKDVADLLEKQDGAD